MGGAPPPRIVCGCAAAKAGRGLWVWWADSLTPWTGWRVERCPCLRRGRGAAAAPVCEAGVTRRVDGRAGCAPLDCVGCMWWPLVREAQMRSGSIAECTRRGSGDGHVANRVFLCLHILPSPSLAAGSMNAAGAGGAPGAVAIARAPTVGQKYVCGSECFGRFLT